MKAYIINLERAAARRKHIVEQADKAKLDYELLRAVDGAELTTRDLAAYCDIGAIRRHPNWLTRGMLGAALSHRNAYGKMIDDDLDIAVVIEDDVYLPADLNVILASIEREIANDEVVLVHYTSLAKLELSKHDGVSVLGYELLFPMSVDAIVSAACYVITRRAAERLYTQLLPIRLAPDAWREFIEQGIVNRIRFLHPRPVSVIGAKSTIHSIDQSSLRSRLTGALEDTPIAGRVMRKLRTMRTQARMTVGMTDHPSPLQRNA